MRCSTCGHEGRAGSASCSRCGTPFADPGLGFALDDRTVMRPVMNAPVALGGASRAATPSADGVRATQSPQPIATAAQPAIPSPQWAQPPAIVAGPVTTQAQMSASVPAQYPAQRTVVVVANRKSVGVALLLTFFFGPLGMFYSTVAGALTMLAVSFGGAFLTGGFSVFITAPACMVWGAVAAKSANDRVLEQVTTR